MAIWACTGCGKLMPLALLLEVQFLDRVHQVLQIKYGLSSGDDAALALR